MNKQKFMEQLEVLLFRIPQVERDEALQYYANYFEDAGEEKEDEVIEELGSPDKVAKTIFDEIGQAQNMDDASQMEHANQERDTSQTSQVKENKSKKEHKYKKEDKSKKEQKNKKEKIYNSEQEEVKNIQVVETIPKKKMSKPRKIVMICTSPIWAPILFAIWVILISFIVAMAVLVFSITIVAIAFVIVGLAAIIDGFIRIFLFPAYALCVIGAGFASVAIAILFLLFILLLIKTVIPALSKAFVLSYTLPFKTMEEK